MDHYQILGIKDTASKDEIKKAYRKLALTSHPDKNQSSNAAEQFRAVNEAYKVLKDDHKRELYDRFELPSLRASRVRSHDRFGTSNEQRPRRTKYDEQFFTGSSEVFSEELRYKNELDRIRKSNSELLDATNSKRKANSVRNKTANRPSSKRTTGGFFVGEIFPEETDDNYEKIVLDRLRALGRN